jgi:putative flavoprotein involved in K+ transport
MDTTDAIVIGAGQAGLAMSQCLSERSIEHVVLERGRRAERWRSERWDSLRLLTPNWMTRLPGWEYRGTDPGGFMTAAEFATHLDRYADATSAPVHEEQAVEALTFDGDTYHLATDTSTWRARNVVLATGWCDQPAVPTVAASLSSRITQVVPRDYRNPHMLPGGGVLVVGASATGVQIAAELRESGREVVLAVGSHSRLPRRYRGMDIFWWLERIGNFDKTIDQMPDPERARREPSVQLVGRPDGRNLDLTELQRRGVRLAGRLEMADGARVTFADDLAATTAIADQRMQRVLGEIDRHIVATGLSGEVFPSDAPRPVRLQEPAPRTLDLHAAGIDTVVWATGHRRAYPWLQVPVLDARGEIAQRRGITSAPGLYVLGQRFQHHRNSNFIDGVGRDAAAVAQHLAPRIAAAARH